MFCIPENDAASPIPLTSVLVTPGPCAVIRAHAEASRTVMLTYCGLPFHMHPAVPTGVGETALPSTCAASSTVNSLHGSAALAGRGSATISPNDTSIAQRHSADFTGTSLALEDSSIAQQPAGRATRKRPRTAPLCILTPASLSPPAPRW